MRRLLFAIGMSEGGEELRLVSVQLITGGRLLTNDRFRVQTVPAEFEIDLSAIVKLLTALLVRVCTRMQLVLESASP